MALKALSHVSGEHERIIYIKTKKLTSIRVKETKNEHLYKEERNEERRSEVRKEVSKENGREVFDSSKCLVT